jgi:hypothetical protein
MAVAALSRREVNRIILTRPAVEAGERLGFLPGDLMAKVDPYLRPLFDAMNDMLDPERVTAHLEKGVIEVAPLAFMRGRAQPVDEPVMTPDGWRPIGSLRVGDLVIGSDGAPTVVLGVYPQGRRAVFRVSVEGGASTRACAEHLWTVRDGRTLRTDALQRVELPLLSDAWRLRHPMDADQTTGVVALVPETVTWRSLQSVTSAGVEETVCIQVSAADSLYVTKDFLLTHNTLNDSFVILDEAQNTSPEQMKMFLTRLGFGSKMVVNGDVSQIDLPRDQRSGLVEVGEILRGVEGVGVVHFGNADVVRHKLVQRIVQAYADHSEQAAPDLQSRRRA